jgi:hypothetical protein
MSIFGFFGTLWIFGIIVVSIITLIHMFTKKVPCSVCQVYKRESRFSEGNIQYWKDGYYEHNVMVAVCKSCEKTHEIDEPRMLSGESLGLSGFVKRKDIPPPPNAKPISWTTGKDRLKETGVVRYVGVKREE